MKPDNTKKALDALKSLETFGYKEREVPIGDVNLTIAPLTNSEVIEIFELTAHFADEEAAIMKMKSETVARAIIKVNDIKLDPKGMIDEKRAIVANFGDELIDILFDEYCELDNILKATIIKKDNSIIDSIEETKKDQ